MNEELIGVNYHFSSERKSVLSHRGLCYDLCYLLFIPLEELDSLLLALSYLEG